MNPTGSKLDLIAACPAAAALPVVNEPSGEAAERGKAIHKYLQTGEVVAGFESECEAIDCSVAVPATTGRDMREATFVWDPSTGGVEFAGYDLERDYSAHEWPKIPITVDRVFALDGEWFLVDYKTGDIPPPPDCLQLRFGAMCLAKYQGIEHVHVSIVHINKKGRVTWLPQGAPSVLDAIDFAITEYDLKQMVKRVDEARAKVDKGIPPDVNTGSHCEYCQATAFCPAYSGMIKRAVEDSDIVAKIEEMPLDRLPEAKLMAKKVAKMVKDIDKAIKVRLKAAGGEVVGAGGRLVTMPVPRPHVIPSKAVKVFEKFDIKPHSTVSFTMKDILKAAGEKGKEVERALFEAGALVYVDSDRVLLKKE